MKEPLNLVVIGGSAGALDAMVHIAQRLPRNFNAAVLCVLHRAADEGTVIPRILNRISELSTIPATDGERIEPGRIYVATMDRHMIIEDGTIHLSAGPKENGFRPAIDPALRSAAAAHGARAVGVLLSGGLDDGVLGLAAIKAHGGTTIVQDPVDAPFPSMPANAIDRVEIDHVLPVARIPEVLTALVGTGLPAAAARRGTPPGGVTGASPQPSPVRLSCPDCGGVLTEVTDDPYVRFQCMIGHAYSPQSLLESHAAHVEETLWAGLRSLEERGRLFRRMASHAREQGRRPLVERYDLAAQDLERHARIMREFIERIALRVESPDGDGAETDGASIGREERLPPNSSRG